MRILNFKEIGKRIRMQREALGMTREQLAEKLEVSAKFCSDIELGVKGMSIGTLSNLCDVLHLSSDYILFGTSQYENPELETWISFYQKCPPQHQQNLSVILRAFLKSVSDSQEIS